MCVCVCVCVCVCLCPVVVIDDAGVRVLLLKMATLKLELVCDRVEQLVRLFTHEQCVCVCVCVC